MYHLLSSFPLTTALTASSSPRDMPEPCVTPQPPLTVVPSAIVDYLPKSTRKRKQELFKNPSKRPSGYRETESNSSDAFRFSRLFGFLVYSQAVILFGCHITYKGPAQTGGGLGCITALTPATWNFRNCRRIKKASL